MKSSRNTYQIVKSLCVENNVTLKELAKAVGVNPNTFKSWEERSPTGDTLSRLADYFDVSVDYLLGRKNYKELTKKDEKDVQKILTNIYNGLSDSASLAYLNNGGEDVTEGDAELLKAAIQSAVIQSKIIAKNKFTRKDYR